jgi:hypothetical protein
MIERKRTLDSNSMRCRFGRLLPVVAAAVLMAGTPIRDAGAQTAGPVLIRETLQQARVLYEELLPLVRRLGDETLTRRMEVLRSQWVQANGHLQGSRLQNAQRLSQRNLEQLRQLAGYVQRLSQQLPYYTRLAERNRELLQLLRRRVGPDAPPEIVRQLTLAADAVQRAQQARQSQNLVQAFRLMEQAETLLQQVLRYVNRTGLTVDAVRLEIEQTDRRIEQITASQDLTPQALEALNRARELQADAKRLLAAGQLQPAITRTLTARTAVRLATRLSAGALTYEDAAAAVGHTEELLELHAELARHPAEEVRTLFAQAQQQLEQARSYLTAGSVRPAMETAQAAAKLILTAARRAGAIPPGPHIEPSPETPSTVVR